MPLILSEVVDGGEVLSSQWCKLKLSTTALKQSLKVLEIYSLFKIKFPFSFKTISISALLYSVSKQGLQFIQNGLL